jgi:hypothetical protein
MSKIKKEISVISGKYTNAQGTTKNRYTRIGSIIETKSGDMLKLDVTPLMEGGWNGWAYINEPKPKEEGFPKDKGFPEDDDMPF